MSLTIWLIRHGQTTINAGEWSNQPTRACLTDLGKKQAKQAASRIKESPDNLIVSPLKRARETANFIIQRWPQCDREIAPIQEFIYLSPDKLGALETEQRKALVQTYWEQCDPLYQDGADTESFSTFLKRIEQFHRKISQASGFIVVVGHGQFFKAWQLGLTHGFHASPAFMQLYRQEELLNPIKNGEIIELLLEQSIEKNT